jgi:polyphenol oxidase
MTTAHDSSLTGIRVGNGVGVLPVLAWSGFDWLWHGFSTHLGGVSRVYLSEERKGQTDSGQLNLGYTTADAPENVHENRLRWIEAISGDRTTPLATVRQVHSNRSIVVSDTGTGEAPEADGIMTSRRGLLIGVQTADCIPVLVADPVNRAVAAFHAGWRGTVARIVELGITRMRTEFGSDPACLVGAIGPGIGACCYTVGEEVREKFEVNFSHSRDLFSRHGEDLRLDLTEANRRQLLEAGLRASSIAAVGGCTSCQPEQFFSHRASGGHAGRMMAVIGIR